MIAPVRHELTVPLPPALAFDLFLNRMGDWWPLLTHSVWAEQSRTCTVDVRLGGQIVEHGPDGATSHWGTILELEEGARVLIDWHPGHSPHDSTQVDVTFAPFPGGTRLVLEHRKWERRGADAELVRQSYDRGWAMVLGCYVDYAKAPEQASTYSK